jgi:hypothetical protein
MKSWQDAIVAAIRAVKTDQESLKPQNEFFAKARHPLDTRPQNCGWSSALIEKSNWFRAEAPHHEIDGRTPPRLEVDC